MAECSLRAQKACKPNDCKVNSIKLNRVDRYTYTSVFYMVCRRYLENSLLNSEHISLLTYRLIYLELAH